MKSIHHNVTIEFDTNFELEQVFCSCSTQIGRHDKTCPNYCKVKHDSPTYLTLRFDDGKISRMRLDKYTWLEEPDNEALHS